MFELEIKRSIGGKTFFYLFIVTGVAFLMGWVLPVGIDGINELSLEDFLFSTYTVFTQFGFLIFAFGTVYFVNRDYSQHNIIFYKSFGTNCLSFYFRKVAVLFLEEILSIAVFISLTGGIYQFSIVVFASGILYALVALYYFLISALFAILFQNMLIAMGGCTAFWIVSLIMVQFGGVFKHLAVFDASNTLYGIIENYFASSQNNINNVSNVPWGYILSNLFLVALACFVIATACRRRWIKVGLQ